MTRSLYAFIAGALLVGLAGRSHADSQTAGYLECLKALGSKEPKRISEMSLAKREAATVVEVNTTAKDIEFYLNLPAFEGPAATAMEQRGTDGAFQEQFAAAITQQVPTLIQGNSTNLKIFIQLMEDKCKGLSPLVDKSVALFSDRFKEAIRLNGLVEKRVTNDVEENVVRQLFNNPEAKKPFPWKTPEKVHMQLQGYLQTKLGYAREEQLKREKGEPRKAAPENAKPGPSTH
jgi:hypothetical protein